MSERRLMNQYMVGDTVKMSMEIVHEMNLHGVYVFFRHETESQTEILLYNEGTTANRKRMASGEKMSVWELSTTITIQHLPGLYNIDRINLSTAAGKTLALPVEEHLPPTLSVIQVVEEPDSTPYFGTVAYEP